MYLRATYYIFKFGSRASKSGVHEGIVIINNDLLATYSLQYYQVIFQKSIDPDSRFSKALSVSDSIARKMILSLVNSVPELSRERAFPLFDEIIILSCGGAEAWCSEGEYVSFDGAYSVDVRLKQLGMPSWGYEVLDADRTARKIPVTLSRVCLGVQPPEI